MPRGPQPQWRIRKEPLTHPHIQASLDGGVNAETGHYKELIYTGCETQERALEIKRSLYRCAKHMGVSMKADIESAIDGTYQVRFKAIDKSVARAYMIKRYGPDRQNWPYNARARQMKE